MTAPGTQLAALLAALLVKRGQGIGNTAILGRALVDRAGQRPQGVHIAPGGVRLVS
ncbi:hypothetical protein [Streptomyces sp. bgisy034]|uniref:hypothetical protein n=1 Tax=Streptomyces sp. bgisy034 TaxID=3413774 RepID=UPI003EC0066B